MRRADLLRESQKLRKEADLLLQKSGLVKLLSQYGRVKPTGSYSLDLMVAGDIDIHVIGNSFDKEQLLGLFNRLIRDFKFRGYRFAFDDWIRFRRMPERPDLKLPKGYYIGLKTIFREVAWNFDIWFQREGEEEERKSDRLMRFVRERLDDETKFAILKLKKYKRRVHPNIPSVKVYEAVLKSKVRTVRNFERYLRTIRPPT